MKLTKYLLILLLLPTVALADSTRCVSVAPTIDTAAYITGDVMGTELAFSNILKDSTKAGYVTSAVISDAADQAVDLELVIFDQDPSAFGSDNAPFDPTDTDIKKIRGRVLLSGTSDLSTYNDNAVLAKDSISIAVGGHSSAVRTLYVALVARGAYDGDADSLQVTLCVSQD